MPKDLASYYWPRNMGCVVNRNYFMPSNLAEAMIKLLDHSSNEGLAILSQALGKGEHVLGNLWADQLTQQAALDLQTVHTVLPGIDSQFRAAQPSERAQFPTTVDPQLLEGTTVNFSRSLVPACLDAATCRHHPTHGRRHSSSTELPNSRSQ